MHTGKPAITIASRALLPVVLMALAAFALTAQEQGLAVFEEVDRRASGYQDLQVRLEMVLRNRRGDETRRSLSIKQLEVPEDGDKMLVVFETPKSIKGTALLSFAHKREIDDQWLYLPAISRVKKIAARNKSGPFVSSEFSFEDLTPQELEKFTYRYLRAEALDGEPCHVVERVPIDELSGYTRQVVWVDQAEYRVLKIEYYDRRESLLKTLSVSGYRLYHGTFWQPAGMFMQNHQSGKSTELFWREYVFGSGLTAERDFSTNSLRRVR